MAASTNATNEIPAVPAADLGGSVVGSTVGMGVGDGVGGVEAAIANCELIPYTTG